MFQISGPPWIERTYYDVTAKAPEGASRLQIVEMLRKLLSERFQMKVRFEAKESNGWALVVGRSPVKLKPTSLPGEPTVDFPDGVPKRWSSTRFGSAGRKEAFYGESMHGLALDLWGELGGDPVQDLTGLTGAYDFTLDLEGVDRLESPSPYSERKALGALGLDLVRQRVQTKRLIVESATMTPIPN